jgi:ABC-2 family transporter protein
VSAVALRSRSARVRRTRRVMPSSMLIRELLATAARPRALLIKMVVPLALVLPLLVGHAPTFWAAMLLTVLIAMIGAVGSAVTIARSRDSGFLSRLALTPRPPWRIVVSWILGAVVADALQLVPALIAVLVLGAPAASSALALVCIVIAALLLANVIGAVVSVLGGGPGEVLLDVIIVVAPLLFIGGLFSGIPREGWRWVAAHVDPFAYVHSAFIGVLGGTPTFTVRPILAASAATVVASLLLLALLARPILRRR